MKLTLFLIVLACVGSSLGKFVNEHKDVHKGGRSGSSLFKVRGLIRNLKALIKNDETIDRILQYLITTDELNTVLNEAFNNEIFPEIKKAQDVQNAALTAAEDKAKALLALENDIVEVVDNIDELQIQVQKEQLSKDEIRDDIKNLQAGADAQDKQLDAAEYDLLNQDGVLSKLEYRAHAVADTLVVLREKIRKLINILNAENAQTLEITLTSGKNAVSKPVTADFAGRRPNIQYGITALHVSDRTESHVFKYPHHKFGKNAGPKDLELDPSIYFNVDVDLDEASNKVTARLYDLSTGGWSVDKVIVQIALYKQDNGEFVYEKKHVPVHE